MEEKQKKEKRKAKTAMIENVVSRVESEALLELSCSCSAALSKISKPSSPVAWKSRIASAAMMIEFPKWSHRNSV